jgi:hypothetical protein
MEQRQRIVAAWLNYVSVAYIAHVEGVSAAEVMAVIHKAARQPRRTAQI